MSEHAVTSDIATVVVPTEMVNQLPTLTFTPAQVGLIKHTVCKNATDDELALFLYTCKRTGLDPLTKQIYAVKRFDKKTNHAVMAIQVGIDGFRLTAERTKQYAGSLDPVYDIEDATHPNKATVTVRKVMATGQLADIIASARWSEYCPPEGMDFLWKKMPYFMLGKCAEALALRKAFPAELSGVYTQEEVATIGQSEPETASPLTATIVALKHAEAPSRSEWKECLSQYEQTKCSVCEKPIALKSKMLYSPKIKNSARHPTCHQQSQTQVVEAQKIADEVFTTPAGG